MYNAYRTCWRLVAAKLVAGLGITASEAANGMIDCLVKLYPPVLVIAPTKSAGPMDIAVPNVVDDKIEVSYINSN